MKKNTLTTILITIINLCLHNLECFSQGFELNRTINWRFGHAAGLNFDKNNNYCTLCDVDYDGIYAMIKS